MMTAKSASVTVEPASRAQPRMGYFYLGSVILTGFLLQATLGISWPALDHLQTTLPYKIGSGMLLLAYLGTQWQVPYLRMRGRVSAASKRLAEHRTIGVLGPLILYLHAAKLGTNYTFLLSTLFLGNAALALLNRETLGIKARGFWLSWLTLHIILAVTVTTLGALHVCNALYYE